MVQSECSLIPYHLAPLSLPETAPPSVTDPQPAFSSSLCLSCHPCFSTSHLLSSPLPCASHLPPPSAACRHHRSVRPLLLCTDGGHSLGTASPLIVVSSSVPFPLLFPSLPIPPSLLPFILRHLPLPAFSLSTHPFPRCAALSPALSGQLLNRGQWSAQVVSLHSELRRDIFKSTMLVGASLFAARSRSRLRTRAGGSARVQGERDLCSRTLALEVCTAA